MHCRFVKKKTASIQWVHRHYYPSHQLAYRAATKLLPPLSVTGQPLVCTPRKWHHPSIKVHLLHFHFHFSAFSFVYVHLSRQLSALIELNFVYVHLSRQRSALIELSFVYVHLSRQLLAFSGLNFVYVHLSRQLLALNGLNFVYVHLSRQLSLIRWHGHSTGAALDRGGLHRTGSDIIHFPRIPAASLLVLAQLEGGVYLIFVIILAQFESGRRSTFPPIAGSSWRCRSVCSLLVLAQVEGVGQLKTGKT